MLNWKPWIFIWLICVQSMIYVEAENNLSNHKLSGIIQWKYEKRPFCNAFTGCGKKRASVLGPSPSSSSTSSSSYLLPYPILKRNEIDPDGIRVNEDIAADGLSDLIDINAEPAVENVQKQIMSQAKIFEAIREASKEIFRQKNKQKLRGSGTIHPQENSEDVENI